MWGKKKWHKYISVILAVALLMATLTVPTPKPGGDVEPVRPANATGLEVNDNSEMDNSSTETEGQEITGTELETTETTDEGEAESEDTYTEAQSEEEPSADDEKETQAVTEASTEADTTVTTEQPITTEVSTETDTPAQTEPFTIKGNVTLESLTGETILWKDMLVRLYDADTYDDKAELHPYLAQTRTKNDGTYTFEGVAPGNYRVEFINRNEQYEDIICKWKKPTNGDEKLYSVELTEQKAGLEEGSSEDDKEDRKYLALIKKVVLPQEALLHMEPDSNDTYMEVNLELMETKDTEKFPTIVLPGQSGEEQTDDAESGDEYSGSMTIEDLKHIDEDIVAATTEKEDQPEVMPLIVNTSGWSFDAYYLNEDDLYDVYKTNDFSLKYQVEFSAKDTFEPETVKIRVPSVLLETRKTTVGKITPAAEDIAAPKGTPEEYKESKDTPFNYYEDGDYYVFFNYKAIEAGTNTAFQILYRVDDVLYIKDGSNWSLQPTITVTRNGQTESGSTTPLTGIVDTGVDLTSVTQSAYSKDDTSYMPGLYTRAQVERYLGDGVTLPEPYASHFSDYKYVLWKVEIRGTATQPWRLEVKDNTTNNGTVIGAMYAIKVKSTPTAEIRDFTESVGTIPSDEYLSISSTKWDTIVEYNGYGGTDHFYAFYIVTAYPAEDVKEGDLIENTIEVRLVANDTPEDSQVKSSTARWTYEDYTYRYKGNEYKLEKKLYNMSSPYKGWMDIYRKVKETDSNMELPEINFTISNTVQGYGMTHYTEGEQLGERIAGTSYKVVTVDDAVRAEVYHPERKSFLLDDKDYYYSSIRITQSDQGYDVYEEAYAVPEDDEIQTLEIYAMFEGKDTWEKVDTVDWTQNKGGILSYNFSSALIERHPWRVKVEHSTVNYQTNCTINVSLKLKVDSPILEELQQATSIDITNISGMYVQQYNPAEGIDGEYVQGALEGGWDFTGDAEISELTERIYGAEAKLRRDSAYIYLEEIEKAAAAYKTGKTTNDPANSRTKVTYQLSAYDGYRVKFQDTVDILKELGVDSPGRKEVVFYDLLPYGMQFDPSAEVVAVRLTDSVGPGAWNNTDSTNVSLKGKPEFQTNYNNTGRTLVIFRIVYTGEDDPSYFNNELWTEHWGVQFTAYYEWKDINLVKNSSNAAAFMPARDDNKALLGTNAQVARDDGKVVPEYLADDCKDFGKDIDGDGNEDEQTVLYASALVIDDVPIATQTQIEKRVRADSDRFATYQKSTVVAAGEDYTYNITVSASNDSIKHIVVFDHLENGNTDFKGNRWYGTFKSVITDSGVTPTIYYNASRGDALLPDSSNALENVLTKENGWYTETEWAAAGYKTDQVQAVAVDFGEDFTLESGESLSFQIQMKAPAQGVENGSYAFNDLYYWTENTGVALRSEYASVKLSDMEQLEIIKAFEGNIPDSKKDSSFKFYLSRMQGDTQIKFSDQEYELWKKVDSKWVLQDEDKIHATDANGVLKLHADEKAVFETADAAGVIVEEEEDPYWGVRIEEPDNWIRTRTITFTNSYRPILFVRKQVTSVPEGTDISGEEFKFQLLGADGEPLEGVEFWYVNDVVLGGKPKKVTELGDNGIGKTGSAGTFTIKVGEIIALFPGEVGTRYTVKEIDIEPEEWICENDEVSGELPERGAAISFTNIYAKKELNIVKKITHQDASKCTQSFTFQILDVTDDNNGVAVTGNDWVLLDEEGKETSTVGYLDNNGEFSCAMAGKTVKISGLMVNHTYRIIETNSGEDYVPVQSEMTVTMSLYSTGKTVTFTNDYQRRSLTINERLIYTLPIEGAGINKPYDYMLLGAEFQVWFAIKDANGNPSYPFMGSPDQRPSYVKTDQDGNKTSGTLTAPYIGLKNGESVYIEDLGKKGDEIVVWVQQALYSGSPITSYYKTIYPEKTDTYILGEDTKVLGNEDCEVTFIHGIPGQDDFLTIIKDVSAGNEGGSELIGQISSSPSIDIPEFEFTLSIQDGTDTYTWPKKEESVQVINLFTNSSNNVTINPGENISLKPGDMMLITGLSGDASYTFSEISGSRHFLYELEKEQRWFDFSQKEPANGKAVTGTVGANPVATIVNQVTEITYDGSQIEKRMAPGSSAVSEGAALVWQLQRYDGSRWKPAEGVTYTLLDADENPDERGILSTGADGKILMTKAPDSYPVVQFMEDTVYLNYYDDAAEGDLRLVELIEESDKSWGRLAGYGNMASDYSLSMSRENAVAFVNSNRNTPMEIAKEMDNAVNETFTMYLNQVYSLTGSTDIRESVAGSGIEYILYDARTGNEAGRGTTGTKGEILLKAGQYARLYLPDKTLWTVSEELKAGYILEDLEGTPDDIMTKLDDNLMLVNAKAELINPCYIKAAYTGEQPIIGADSLEKDKFEIFLCDSDGNVVGQIDPNDCNITYPQNYDAGYMKVTVSYGGMTTTTSVEVYGKLRFNYEKHVKNADYYNDEGIKVEAQGTNIYNYDSFELPSTLHKGGRTYIVTAIDDYGFYNVTIKSIMLPDTVTEIGERAFYYRSSLQDIDLGKGVEKIRSYAFSGCSKVETIQLPDSLIEIGESAFSACTALRNINLPDSVTEIGQSAFYNCSALQEVKIPDSLTKIENSVFNGCSGLSSITIPNSVKSVGNSAFSGCLGLGSITIPNSVESIGDSAFSGCSSIGSVTIPGNVKTVGKQAFSNCILLSELNIEDGVIEMGGGIISGCEKLEYLYLPKSLEKFSVTSSYLKVVEMEDGIKLIPDSAFSSCSLIESVKIPDSVTSIGKNAFSRTALSSIIIPDGVTTIGDEAFFYCSKLKEVWIPASVETFGERVLLTGLGSQLEHVYIARKESDFTDQGIDIRKVLVIPDTANIHWVDDDDYIPPSKAGN